MHFLALVRLELAVNCVNTTKTNATMVLATTAVPVLIKSVGLNAVVRQASPVPDVKVTLTNVSQILVTVLAQLIVTS